MNDRIDVSRLQPTQAEACAVSRVGDAHRVALLLKNKVFRPVANRNAMISLLNLREAIKTIESIAAGTKVPCSICGEPLIVVRAKNGDLVGAKCPKATFDHDWVPWRIGATGADIRELIKSVEAGKKVPCSTCAEPLVIARSDGYLGAKCPNATFEHDWIHLPYGKGKRKTGTRELIDLIMEGNRVPCLVCGEPLIVVRINEGVTCPHSHMFYPLLVT